MEESSSKMPSVIIHFKEVKDLCDTQLLKGILTDVE